MIIGITQSTCPVCRCLVPARVECNGEEVYFNKWCPEHGTSRERVYHGVAAYLANQRFVKPAWRPRVFAGDINRPCPDGCGFCTRHEQHLCLPIVEITSRCNLACPICLVDAGGEWDMPVAQFSALLDRLIEAEVQIPVLNLSGGEPLLHPHLLDLVDAALARREIVRVSISTNGLPLLDHPDLLRELQTRDVVISLQCDGFSDQAYYQLRGEPLASRKHAILDLLAEADCSVSLTMTVARSVNEDQLAPMLDLFFASAHIGSLMIQPLAFTGRAAAMDRSLRLTIPEVVALLGTANHPAVHSDDFLPLPCSHPLCFNLAFYLTLPDGKAVSLAQLAGADEMLDRVANQVFWGLHPDEYARTRELVYRLWSGPAATNPHSGTALAALRGLLRAVSTAGKDIGFDPRTVFRIAERRLKSVFIHAFQDTDTFDLARARRCCNAYPQPDGQLLPVCVRNVLRKRQAP